MPGIDHLSELSIDELKAKQKWKYQLILPLIYSPILQHASKTN